MNALIREFLRYECQQNLIRQRRIRYKYAITVSPHKKYDHMGIVVDAINDLFDLYKGVRYIQYIEEVSPAGKSHLHGVVYTRDPCKFAKVRKHPTCHFKVTEFEGGNTWYWYLSKTQPTVLWQRHRHDPEPLYKRLEWYSFVPIEEELE